MSNLQSALDVVNPVRNMQLRNMDIKRRAKNPLHIKNGINLIWLQPFVLTIVQVINALIISDSYRSIANTFQNKLYM